MACSGSTNTVGLSTALATGLYPFVIVDVIKIVAAGLVLPERVEVPRAAGKQ